MKSKLVKLWNTFKTLLKQGLAPKQLAMSLVISTLVSIFPMFGVSTIVLTCIALPFRLNLPIMIAFSYIIEPLKFLVLIPFINLGAMVFGTEHTLLTFEAIKASYELSFFNTIKTLSYELLCGFVGWTLTAIPSGIIFFFFLKVILTYFDKLKTNQLTTK
ncbi:DUF2062 domain-containing protein [Flavivirga aquimarina]|uniref:DUF2062 domain-containing protein n=1 Tax=Flavivirga aquimarina TaxID=2027862 RepID=A0ABT8WCY6_9FLAO|nr:DUF2062 domain-containing protein [Flavivirga aquimarina]MDO5970980.1 DUF2062 domain-containing protein [Flavivirga aquimarina]